MNAHQQTLEQNKEKLLSIFETDLSDIGNKHGKELFRVANHYNSKVKPESSFQEKVNSLPTAELNHLLMHLQELYNLVTIRQIFGGM